MVRVCRFPPRTPADCAAPARIIIVFVPSDENWSVMDFWTVSPTATIITTAITPITIPKTVKKDRILLPLMDSHDSLAISCIFIFYMPLVYVILILGFCHRM